MTIFESKSYFLHSANKFFWGSWPEISPWRGIVRVCYRENRRSNSRSQRR